jgi:integrase
VHTFLLPPRPDADELVPPEVEDRRVRYLTEDEYQRLRYAARHDRRDAAMIELLLQTGMRLSDVAGLQLGDISLHPENVCTARVGSGRHRRRIVRLNTKAREALNLDPQMNCVGQPRVNEESAS